MKLTLAPTHPAPGTGPHRAPWRDRPWPHALQALSLALAMLPLAASALLLAVPAQAQMKSQAQGDVLWTATACRLKGVEHGAWCYEIKRPLDPAQAQGPQITLHFARLPALARNKLPDPVFFFAGGPGQSAIDLAGPVAGMLSRFGNRRDIVLIDQRGTGRSAPLACEEEPAALPLRESVDMARMQERLAQCLAQLQRLPHGDLRLFTTALAAADVDAVRAALGAEKVNLVGGSYGTRMALEYQRQFPQRVRRSVIDGVAPPDMALPASFSTDAQAAMEALLRSCEAGGSDPACAKTHPQLRAQWQAVLQSLPREVRVQHPLTGQEESFTLTRDALANLVRQPLYLPVLASALPQAIAQAAQGRFGPLIGLGSAMASRGGARLSWGMHFSVVCAEDMPRLAQSPDTPGADFGQSALKMYQGACANWPRGEVPPAFYTVPAAQSAVLVLSGGADPVTPPRHGQRVAQALGAKALHVVVPNAGHGTLQLGCMRDVVFRFVDAASDEAALAVKADCAAAMPRPPAYAPFSAAAAAPAASAPRN